MTDTGKDGNVGLNGTEITTEPMLDEEILHVQKGDRDQVFGLLERTPARGRALDSGGGDSGRAADDFALAPLVDKIAYGIARGLIVAVKELEHHIATETRKVGDAVDRRLDMVQTSLQDLSRFVGEQQATNAAVQGQLQQLTTSLREVDSSQTAGFETLRSEARELSASMCQRIDSTAESLKDSDVRQATELEALRSETRAVSSSVSKRIDGTVAAQQESEERRVADLAAMRNETKALSEAISERIDSLSRELSVQQEDIAALKTALGTFSSRTDALVERLDRQADAVRSMYIAYSQRETELEQLVDGLARLRAQPTPLPTNGL